MVQFGTYYATSTDFFYTILVSFFFFVGPYSSLMFFFLIFMEGRNRKLQGLAEAIIKLWEKSLVAKIAIKVGMFTDNAQMASELKVLNFF